MSIPSFDVGLDVIALEKRHIERERLRRDDVQCISQCYDSGP